MTNEWRNKIEVAARALVGTAFHHQGRLPGVGVDCVGVLVCVARACRIPHEDSTAYSRYPDGVTLRQEIAKSMDPIPVAAAGVGDCLVFTLRRHPCHVGIRTSYGIVHAYASVGKVVEHGYVEPWIGRTAGAYRYRGVN